MNSVWLFGCRVRWAAALLVATAGRFMIGSIGSAGPAGRARHHRHRSNAAYLPLMRCLFAALAALALRLPVNAAESTTGILLGSVLTTAGTPVGKAEISAVSASGRYAAVTDARGRFTILGIIADTYLVSAQAPGYAAAARSGITVLPGASAQLTFRIEPLLKTIGSVRATASAIAVGSSADTFTVSGQAARAQAPVASSSGLGNYAAGSVQGAISAVPGVGLDSFGNAILRGGKVDDASFNYDSVPVPQGLVAEPGGNVVGAQLPTTGIAATVVTLGGFQAEGENALGGTIDQIPAVGTYPGQTTLEYVNGTGPQASRASFTSLWATPDRRWRYAASTTVGSEYFAYGDGHTFYPAEAGTYGLALQSRRQWSSAANVHFSPRPNDDFSFIALVGAATYDAYGTPFGGQRAGAFDYPNPPPVNVFPGETNPDAIVTTAASVHGTYDILKAQWVHTFAHSLRRVQVYQTQFGSQSGGPFWDDLSFPNGSISLLARQGGRQTGFNYDVDDVAGERQHVKYGIEYRVNNSFLTQVVPTANEFIASNPTLFSYLAYAGDTWNIGQRFDVTATARYNATHIVPSSGTRYGVTAIDPHGSAVYRLGNEYALRVSFDHTTVAPKPLEADRTDSTNVDTGGAAAPFVPLAPETTNAFTYSFEGGRRTPFRLTYFAEHQRNRIDVLPANFRSVAAGDSNASAIGIPTNAGELVGHGLELWVKHDGFALQTNLLRVYSSSASQFAYNGLNAAAVAAGHLTPISYLPDFTTTLSYQVNAGKRVRLTPAISYESGYPYGNGTRAWVFDAVTGKPEQVPNDNFINPGYNYYFLKNPSLPFSAATNPYIGTLGTSEGSDPNTLRTTPQMLVSLHLEGDITRRLTAFVDVFNLLGVTTPTQVQGNPYLIGPPGYTGSVAGSPYATYYGQQIGGGQYTLGNGVPTNDGKTQALPWSYGRAAYVPEGYPMARSVQLGLRYKL